MIDKVFGHRIRTARSRDRLRNYYGPEWDRPRLNSKFTSINGSLKGGSSRRGVLSMMQKERKTAREIEHLALEIVRRMQGCGHVEAVTVSSDP
jgi:hypothetical protein